jgi:DNA-binding protein HU-beta
MTAYLADKIGIRKRQAKSALDEPRGVQPRFPELNELVTRQLKKEGLLRLAGQGVFRKRKLKARMGRNPATGEQIKIPARTRLRFTPAKALKDSVRRAPRNFAACTVRSFPRPRVERSAIFCEPRARPITR